MLRHAFRRAFSTTPRAPLARMQIVGRLGADPELVNTSTGRDLLRYVVASDYGPADNRQTSWFRVASFADGGSRDFILGLKKGTLVHLDADARMSVVEAEDGTKRSHLNLVQRSVEVLSRPKNTTEPDAAQAAQAEAQAASA